VASVLEIDVWPKLTAPVLVYSFSGWVDAGIAGATTAALVTAHLDSAREFARYDVADLVDLSQTRPLVSRGDGGPGSARVRRVTWPTIRLTAGRAGRDVVTCVGPEPSVRWRAFATELTELFVRLGVERAVALGGMPAAVSHRRPVTVLAAATTADLARELTLLRPDYRGATGAQTVLQLALQDVGIPSFSLWAQVPHYVATNVSPPAVVALLARLEETAGVAVRATGLDEACARYRAHVDEGLADHPDVAQLVEALDREPAGAPGGGLVAEIERYLRDERS
jgi:hypothetical protein